MKTYTIPEENLYRFEQIINKLQKRARRLNQAEPGFNVVDEKLVEFKNKDNEISYYKAFVVEVYGVAPVIKGWQFVAVIDTEAAGNIINTLPGILTSDVPDFYRNSGSVCEHCQKERNRKQTFLVYSAETNQYKQVGSACLHDFTGYISPESAASFAEALAAASEEIYECEDYDFIGGAGGGYIYFQPETFLSFVVAIAETSGFVTAKNAGYGTASTAERAFIEISDKSGLYRKVFPTDAQLETAKKVWNWAVEHYEHEENRQNDFGWNYYVITQKSAIKSTDFGRVAYLYVAYNKYQEEQNKRAGNGGFIGKVGEKVSFTGKVVSSKLFSSNYHFSTYLVKFQTDNGEDVTWFASNEPAFHEGDTVEVAGTVKDHSERYLSTTITRCKVKAIELA